MRAIRFSNNNKTNETVNNILALIGYITTCIAIIIAIEKVFEKLSKLFSPIKNKWATKYVIDEQRRESMGATMFWWAWRLHDLPMDIINCIRGKELSCFGKANSDINIETRKLSDAEVNELKEKFKSGEIAAVEGWEEAFDEE